MIWFHRETCEESQFIITVSWLINTVSRWENWIRRIVLSGLLKSSVTAGNRTRALHCHVTTCMSGARVNNVLWKCQEDILSRLKSGNLCRSWRPNNAVMKQKNLCIFFYFKCVGQYPVVFGIKRRMSRETMQIKFGLAGFFV